MPMIPIKEHEFASVPDWAPLESFARLHSEVDADDYMFMGCVTLRGSEFSEVKIRLYKHIETRHYLNLDSGLRCWQYKAPFSQFDPPGIKGYYFQLPTPTAIALVNS